MKIFSLISICFILLNGCEVIPDLERDNINDVNGNNYSPISNSVVAFNKYKVLSDNNNGGIPQSYNNNGIVNSGETVSMEIILKNTGTTTAKNITAKYTISNSNIVSLSTVGVFGDIYSNSLSTFGAEHLQISLKSTTPQGTIIKVVMAIYEDSKYKTDLSFDIVVN